jgi:hypothetical protein
MFRKSLLILACVLLPVAAIASEDLPRTNANGDYATRTSHRSWVVVDPDPQGLNCRWSSNLPDNWFSPSAQLNLNDIDQWDVVRRFRKNTVLVANTSPAGFALLYDSRNKPWLKVSISGKDRICLVRANSQFIQPVNLSTDR